MIININFSYVGGTYTAYLKPNVINASVDSLYSGTVDQGSEYLYEYTYTQKELGGGMSEKNICTFDVI